jgi:hypothetical protein
MVQDRVTRAQRVCIRWSPGLSRSSFALNPGPEDRFRKTASPYRATVDPGSESDPLFTRNKLDLNHADNRQANFQQLSSRHQLSVVSYYLNRSGYLHSPSPLFGLKRFRRGRELCRPPENKKERIRQHGPPE